MSLGDERLSTTDESGKRIFLYPGDARGKFRNWRNITQAVLILFFLILPWLQWNGHQLVHLNIAERSFSLFGHLFKAHDAPLIFLILGIATITLAFVTSVWGRVWCGWACPQTVFIDGVYRRIETFFLGNYLAKRKLQTQPWNFEKLRKFIPLWLAYFLVSSLIAHSFIAYFVGSEQLLQMIQGSPEQNWQAFLLVMGMTLLLLFDFGWFREQFCIVACPYGRIQSVLMDHKTVSVLYDEKRGEPRKGSTLSRNQKVGDCVNCRRCVQVCPTGIDIRRGIQMECIGCTACIDACDEIMRKVNKPEGLIRYSSEYEMLKVKTLSLRERLTKPRSLIYLVLIAVLSIALILSVTLRKNLSVTQLRHQGLPYQVIKTEAEHYILSQAKLHLHNQSYSEYEVTIERLGAVSGVELVIPQNLKILKRNHAYDLTIFAKITPQVAEGRGVLTEVIRIRGTSGDDELVVEKELRFTVP